MLEGLAVRDSLRRITHHELHFAPRENEGMAEIENSLHWVMDMVFRDDECRVRVGNTAANFVTLRHMAHNLARRGAGKISIRARRRAAAWDDEYLLSLAAA